MRTSGILVIVAVVGAVVGMVVGLTLLNVGTVKDTSFMSTEITPVEKAFMSFISEYRRSYGTKEEYEYRLDLFAQKF